MNKLYLLRIDILNMLLRFMVVFTITSMLLLVFTNGDTYIWKSFILFQASILSFVIRKYTNHIWSFLLLHLLLLAAYILITEDLVLRIVYIGFIIIFAITEFIIYIKKNLRNTTLAFSVIFIGMFALCEYAYPREKMLQTFFFYFAILFGLIYILNMYYVNFYVYYKKHEEKVNIPLKQIKSSSTFYILGFLYLVFIIMMLFTKIPVNGILRLLGNIVKRFLRFIFSLLTSKPYEVEEEEVVEEEVEDPYEGFFEQEPTEPSQFWIALSKILITVCMVIAAVLVIALIIYGLYRIYKLYYSKTILPTKEEKVETISPFMKSELSIKSGRGSLRRGILGLFGRSNNDKIRKQYVKAVQKHTDSSKELKYKTPSELSKYALDTSEKQAEELSKKEKEAAITAIYEKARYSNDACGREEIQSMKDLLK